MEENKKRNLPFIISVVLHLALVLILMINEKALLDSSQKKDMEIEWVNIEDLPNTPLEKAQIVEQDSKPLNDVIPEKDYKLSKHNQDVVKETKALKHGEFKNRNSLQEGQKQAQQAQASNNKPQAQKTNKKLSLDGFKPQLFDNTYSASKLAPNPVAAKSGSEVSQSDDYLDDVVADAQTLLKTREFVYYGYYNRIKRKLKQHWEPRIKKKIHKILRQGRRIASVNDKITRLVITLNQGGDLIRIQVKGASGYNDLDDAAIEAFRAAAPFPNPPHGIIDSRGEVQINWDFVLET